MKRSIALIFILAGLVADPGNILGQLSGFRTSFRYIGNSQSHLLHLIYYQHLPPDSLRLNFETLDEALKSGFRKCPICFPPTPLIPGYDFERRMGMETAGVVNYYYPTPAGRAYTDRIRRAGQEIVSNWPFPLKGYKYSFLAIESEEIKAFSCPSGLIYLTTGLIDIIESSGELDMILAHEITHVEQRHALEEYRQQSEAVFQNDPISVADRLNSFARNLVLVGYTDEHEREADFFAVAYNVRRNGLDHQPMSLVLQKLQDVQWRDIRVGGGLFSGRSNLEERIRLIREIRIEPFAENTSFFRRGADGRINARINLLFQKIEKDRLTMYTSIETDETIPFNNQGRSQIVIETGDASYVLVQEDISFIRKPPEGLEREVDFHTYVITFTSEGERNPIAVTRSTIRRIALTRPFGPINPQTIVEFVP
jgi:hypothetical protein